MQNFEELAYLFKSSKHNRHLIRLNIKEAALLYKMVKKSQGDIIEIGRRYGGSTVLLASAAAEGQTVHSIDIERHDFVKKCFRPCPQSVLSKIKLIDAKSHIIGQKWKGPRVGLVFVDGDHRYKGVKRDIRAWCPKVEIGGYAVFHDVRDKRREWGLEPLIKALKQCGWKEVDCADSMVVMQKERDMELVLPAKKR